MTKPAEIRPGAALLHEAAAARPVGGRWIERLSLTDFRSHAVLTLAAGPGPVVLTGPNGAGKTNLLEAISLLSPGSGLRRANYAELGRIGGSGDWAVAARINAPLGGMDVGTGQRADASGRQGRIVRIDGEDASPGALAGHVDIVWLTPAMDGLFMGPASERRRFLDRLVLCFDASHAATSARYERAMRQRNRLLEDGARDGALFDGLEIQIAETGAAIAAARLSAVAALSAMSHARRSRDAASPFPWFGLALEGTLEQELERRPAVEVEDRYRERLARDRERDRMAGRMLEGPHRSDLVVAHGPKDMPARLSSTGEQKALLMGLVLAHAALIAERGDRGAPILLLDEVAAHFDETRRAAMFDEILALGAQAWMTGAEPTAFAGLTGRARFAHVADGRATPIRAA
jgi:DNA replication and repair protein RecF